MNVFVDFEHVLLNQNMRIEEWFVKLRLGAAAIIEYLPYRSKAIYVLTKFYQTDEIILVVHDAKNMLYAQKAVKELPELFGIKTKEVRYCPKATKEQLLQSADGEFISFVGSEVEDKKLFTETINSKRICSFWQYLINPSLWFTNQEDYLYWFEGLFSVFFFHLRIWIFLYLWWPSCFVDKFFIVSHKFDTFPFFMACFISATGFCSFMYLLRTLLETPLERQFVRKNQEILGSDRFILHDDSYIFSFVHLIIFTLIGISGIFINFYGTLVSFLFSCIYFIIVRATNLLKFSVLFISGLLLVLTKILCIL